MTIVAGPRFPVQDLQHAFPGRTLEEFAHDGGISFQYLRHSVKRGLSLKAADKLAIGAGLHPALVWTWWFDVP